MKIKIEAVQVAESFNIKKFRAEYQLDVYSSSTSELFYANDDKSFLYVFVKYMTKNIFH